MFKEAVPWPPTLDTVDSYHESEAGVMNQHVSSLSRSVNTWLVFSLLTFVDGIK